MRVYTVLDIDYNKEEKTTSQSCYFRRLDANREKHENNPVNSIYIYIYSNQNVLIFIAGLEIFTYSRGPTQNSYQSVTVTQTLDTIKVVTLVYGY